MRTIAILNLKGGVGKTVTAINLGHCLAALHNKRVLLVDADSQHNLTDFFGAGNDGGYGVASILRGEKTRYIEHTPLHGMDIMPGGDALMDLDISAARDGRVNVGAMMELVEELAEEDVYDVVLFDCPPAFNAASVAALAAASEVIIPAKLDPFSIKGLGNMVRQVESMRGVNRDLRVSGVLLTMWTKTVADAERQLREKSPLPIFKTVIRRSEKMVSGLFSGDAVVASNPRSAAGMDYSKFARELLGEVT